MKKSILHFILLHVLTISTYAQTTISTSAGYSDQVWYSLENGEQERAELSEWDIAIATGARTSTIRFNDGAKHKIYAVPNLTVTDFANVDTAGIDTWTPLYNSDTTWEIGALNKLDGTTGTFDYTFGDYSLSGDGTHAAHSVIATRVFVILYKDGSCKKLYITGSYGFNGLDGIVPVITSANLDNTNEQVDYFAKTPYQEKSFIYYSIQDNAVLDLEPVKEDWDLLFTQYLSSKYGNYTNQVVGGILINDGVTVQKVVGVNQVTYEDYNLDLFTDTINAIGYDWKSLNYQTFQWEISDDVVYFIQDTKGDIWKFYITGFGGSSNGNHEFVSEKIVDNATVNAIFDSNQNTALSIYPNLVNQSENIHLEVSNALQPSFTSVINTNGKVIAQSPFSSTLTTSNLAKGTYLIRVATNLGPITQRVIIQ